MVVEFLLPQDSACCRRKCQRRLSFVVHDKWQELARHADAFHKRMQMIRHEAIGLDSEVVLLSCLEEEVNGDSRRIGACKEFDPLRAAQGDEVLPGAVILRAGQPDVFSFHAVGPRDYRMARSLTPV